MTTHNPINHDTDSFDTVLITQLANELYRDSAITAQSSSLISAASSVLPVTPTALGGIPGGVPGIAGTPSTFPASFVTVPTIDRPDNPGLAGGYPLATTTTHPPVHAGQTEPPDLSPARKELGSGEHRTDSDEVYPFGEPRCNGSFSAREVYADTVDAAPAFYFLREAGSRAGSAAREPAAGPTLSIVEVDAIRRDFPVLHQRVHGRPLIWFDNAATTQKPRGVIDATSRFYGRDNSNIHRAAHALAARATDLYEGGREKVRQFIGAADTKEIVFVRGTTEAVNLVAQTYGRAHIGRGDEILLTVMEHHANIVPWQILAEQTGALLRVAPINDAGELILEQFAPLLGPRTKLVAVTQVSNALGTINPVEAIIGMAHAQGIPVLVDGAQSAPHLPINVQAMGCDFFVFSGHKIFGPTGIGVLYGKAALLEEMPPYQGGGNMIKDVTFEKTTYQGAPQKFEAGTPDIAGVVGLGAAIDYLTRIGMPVIAAYEHELLEYATQALSSVRGLRPIGTAAVKASVLSFVMDGMPNEQIARHLDRHGIAVRAGHHCAQPTVRRFGLEGTVRPSLAFYNTRDEIDILVQALHDLRRR
ncbi:MAG: cysteine desulfurase [Nitrospira sp.]|nr:cysteine desulfurase [Nitrospira sp.]